jgi:hypothetical protein
MLSSISSSRFERAWSPSSREDIVYRDRGQLGLRILEPDVAIFSTGPDE